MLGMVLTVEKLTSKMDANVFSSRAAAARHRNMNNSYMSGSFRMGLGVSGAIPWASDQYTSLEAEGLTDSQNSVKTFLELNPGK